MPAAALAIACSEKTPESSCAPATLVIGVQGQPGLTGVVGAMRVVTNVDGAPTRSAVYSVADPRPMLPQEIRVDQPAGAAGRRVAVRIDGFSRPGIGPEHAAGDPEVVLTRIADAPFVCGETRLLRLRLEAQCLVAGFPGAFAPACTAPQSCQAGRCATGTLIAEDLEPYSATWADDVADACKPPNAGPPEVILGTGQTDFHPIGSEPIKPEKGPQGGHHLWIAVRMKNLKQTGTTTSITGVQPDTGLGIPVTSFVFTFDRDEGGFCKLFGLRYQLDNAATPVEKFLGKPLDVTIEVKDTTGAIGKATLRVNVGDSVVVPAGL